MLYTSCDIVAIFSPCVFHTLSASVVITFSLHLYSVIWKFVVRITDSKQADFSIWQISILYGFTWSCRCCRWSASRFVRFVTTFHSVCNDTSYFSVHVNVVKYSYLAKSIMLPELSSCIVFTSNRQTPYGRCMGYSRCSKPRSCDMTKWLMNQILDENCSLWIHWRFF